MLLLLTKFLPNKSKFPSERDFLGGRTASQGQGKPNTALQWEAMGLQRMDHDIWANQEQTQIMHV